MLSHYFQIEGVVIFYSTLTLLSFKYKYKIFILFIYLSRFSYLMIWLISIKFDLLPTSGAGSFKHLILPSFTVALTYISTYIRLIRNNMLENMKEDYVLYANVRGLQQKNILRKHILKNSLHSCITAIGMSIPQLIAGTIVVENVFAWPGIGKLCIASIFNRDYPVIQAYVLMVGTLFVIFNLIFDIVQYISDPRLRKGME